MTNPLTITKRDDLKRLSTLSDLSAVALSIGMINKTHEIESVEG
jgi:hypothetical protein